MLTTAFNILSGILKGSISGGIASFLGYAKGEEVPKWELAKASKTVIIGAITSGIISGTGMPISQLAEEISIWLEIPTINPTIVEMFILTSIVIVTDQIVKIIIRRTEIKNIWNKLKEFFSKYVY